MGVEWGFNAAWLIGDDPTAALQAARDKYLAQPGTWRVYAPPATADLDTYAAAVTSAQLVVDGTDQTVAVVAPLPLTAAPTDAQCKSVAQQIDAGIANIVAMAAALGAGGVAGYTGFFASLSGRANADAALVDGYGFDAMTTSIALGTPPPGI